MTRHWSVGRLAALSVPCFLFASVPSTPRAATGDTAIISRTADVDGVRLHYLTAGHGAPVILLHGYTQTSRMWKPIFPRLAGTFTVIAPDLPGIGDSDTPRHEAGRHSHPRARALAGCREGESRRP